MNDITLFLIVFGGIILVAAIISWGLREKHIYYTHYCRYKASTDYERLWNLLHKGSKVIAISPDFEDDGSLKRLWPSEVRLYTTLRGVDRIVLDGECLDDITKEKFLGYCQYKNIQYLDFIEDYNKVNNEKSI